MTAFYILPAHPATRVTTFENRTRRAHIPVPRGFYLTQAFQGSALSNGFRMSLDVCKPRYHSCPYISHIVTVLHALTAHLPSGPSQSLS
jgi:hypothetical protein